MKFSGTIHYKLAADALRIESPRLVPYALASMLTKLAGDVRDELQRELPHAFDRPTDFTLRGVFTKGASKSNLVAEVYFPESVEEAGKAKREFIRPGAKGASSRNQKKTEYLLTRIGALPAGWVTTPGRGAQLDAHGNIPGSVYKQIINVLQIRTSKPKPISIRSQKAAKKLGVTSIFFVVSPGPNKLAKGGGWLPPGVWKHLPGHRITQILKFVKKASYRPRLDLQKIGLNAVKRNVGVRWRESLSIITARFAGARQAG